MLWSMNKRLLFISLLLTVPFLQAEEVIWPPEGGGVSTPELTTDNAVVRWNGVDGGAIQNSGVSIDDNNVVAGITQLNLDNLRIDGNAVSVTQSDGKLFLMPNGSGAIQARDTGNNRGVYATDWQRSGTNSEVASAQGSTIVGGLSNTAGGSYSVTGGNENNAGASYSTVFGKDGTAANAGSTVLGMGGRDVASADFILGNNLSPITASQSNNHFRVAGDTSNVSIGRQTNQSAVTGAENTLKLHTTNASNQSNYAGIKAPSLTASYTLTLPSDDGNQDEVLKTNGSGVLSWSGSTTEGDIGTITWSAGTAPSTLTKKYRTRKDGNVIELWFHVHAGSAGTSVTQYSFTLPTANPAAWAGMSASAMAIPGRCYSGTTDTSPNLATSYCEIYTSDGVTFTVRGTTSGSIGAAGGYFTYFTN